MNISCSIERILTRVDDNSFYQAGPLVVRASFKEQALSFDVLELVPLSGFSFDPEMKIQGRPLMNFLQFTEVEPISCYLYAPHPMMTSSILFKYVVFASTFFVT